MGPILQHNELGKLHFIFLLMMSFLLLAVVDVNAASSTSEVLRNYVDTRKASQIQANVPKPIGSKQEYIPNILFSDNYMTMDEGSFLHLYGSGSLKGDGISIIRRDDPKSQPNTEQNFLKFSPSKLTLSDLQSCKLHSLNFDVENGGIEDLTIQSVSTDVDVLTIQDKEVVGVLLQPGGKITVQLQLLASKSLLVRGSILVITSLGEVTYSIEANIISNPYKVSGLTAIIPSGVRLEHTLMIHNPFAQAIRVSETYSLDGLVHLFLPHPIQISSSQHMPSGLWDIEAKSTKELVTFSFVSRVPNVYKTDIRVVLQNDSLIVPIQIRVLREGLHLEPKEFDLGVITREDERRELKVDLLNSGSVPIQIQDIITEDPNMILSAALRGPTVIPSRTRIKGGIVLRLGHNASHGNFISSLRLVTNHTSLSMDDYTLRVTGHFMTGYLQVKRLDTLIRISSPISGNSSLEKWKIVPAGRSTIHELSIVNMYQEPLNLVDVTIEKGDITAEVKLLNFSRGSVAHSGENWPDIRLQVTATNQNTFSMHSYPIIITTNMTVHAAQLSLFHGFLLVRSKQQLVDLSEKLNAEDLSAAGKVSKAYQMQMSTLVKGHEQISILNITNVNPVPIYFENVIIMSDSVQIDVDGVHPSANSPVFTKTVFTDDDDFLRDIEGNILSGQKPVPPGYTVSLRIRFRPQQYGSNSEHLFQYQTAFEVVSISAQYIAIEGRIFPHNSKIVLPPIYPGKVQVVSLLYGNSFDRAVALMSAKCTNEMMRILSITKFFHNKKPDPAITFAISPLYHNGCSDRGFVADCLVPLNKTYQLSTFKEPILQEDVDAHLDRLEKYRDLKKSGRARLEGEILVQSELMDSTPVRVIVPFTRPHLSSAEYFTFDVTEISKQSSIKIHVVNPSNISILIELSALKNDAMIFLCDSSDDNSGGVHDNKTCYERWMHTLEGEGPNSPFFVELKTVELQPGDEAFLGPVYFSPNMVKDYNATMFIKNSLTHIELIHVVGEGAMGKLEVVEMLTEEKDSALGRNGALRFMTTSVEKDFDRLSSRHLRLINKGQFSVSFQTIDIVPNGETQYFSVSWPSKFTFRNSKLEPGESVLFTVSHTPICHTTRVEDVLSIVSSMDSLSIHLIGEMPRSTAFACLRSRIAVGFLVLYSLLWAISASVSIFVMFTVTWSHRSMIHDRVCELYNRLLNDCKKKIDAPSSEAIMDNTIMLREIMDNALPWDEFQFNNLRYKSETPTVMKLMEIRQKRDKPPTYPTSTEKSTSSDISDSTEYSEIVSNANFIAQEEQQVKMANIIVTGKSHNVVHEQQILFEESNVLSLAAQNLNVSHSSLTSVNEELTTVGFENIASECDLITPNEDTESFESEHIQPPHNISEVPSNMSQSLSEGSSTNAGIQRVESCLSNSSDKETLPVVVEDDGLKLKSSFSGVWLSNSVKEVRDNSEPTQSWGESGHKTYSFNERTLDLNASVPIVRDNGNQLGGRDQKDNDDWSDFMFHSIKSEIGKLVSEGSNEQSNQQEEPDLHRSHWPDKADNSSAIGNLKLKPEDSHSGGGVKAKSTPPGFSPEDANPEESLAAFQNLLKSNQANVVAESTKVGSPFQTSISRTVEEDITLSPFSKPFSLFGSSSQQQTPERSSAFPNAGRIGSRKANTSAASPSLSTELTHNFASLSSLGGVELRRARPPPGL